MLACCSTRCLLLQLRLPSTAFADPPPTPAHACSVKTQHSRPIQSLRQGPTGSGTVSFKVYALKDRLGLEPGATKEQVLAAMKGKVLGKATLSASTSS